MRSLAEVTTTEFEAALTSEALRPLQIIHGALMAGVMSFTAVIAFVYFTSPPALTPLDPASVKTPAIFTGVALLVAPILLLVSNLAFASQFSPDALTRAYGRPAFDPVSKQPITDPADKCVHLLRMAWIFRLAPLEGATLLALTALLVSITSGAIRAQPALWIALLVPLAFVGFGVATFPSKDSLCELFKQRIASAR